MSSLEVSVRTTPGHRFVSHLDVLRNAPVVAQTAPSPFSIPVPKFSYTFKSGAIVSLEGDYVKPDALFGDLTDDGVLFSVIEFDRSTEDIEPSRSLKRSSWLRKVLCYSAISAHPHPIYNTYLGLPNLLVLGIFLGESRMRHAMQITQRETKYPRQFLFKCVEPFDPLLNAALKPNLYSEPWLTAEGKLFDLVTGKEVMT